MTSISRDRTRQNYDRLSRWYDLFAGSEKRFTVAGLQMMDVRAGETVLEIGFGTGHALVATARQVGNSGLIVGIELSPGMIAVARNRLHAEEQEGCTRMVRGDGANLPFAPRSFDAIFLSFTLELFSDSEIPEVLNECYRALKPEGRLGVVSLSAPVKRSGPGEKQGTLACRLYEWGHERWPALLDCRPIHLKEKLEAGGFRIQVSNLMTMWGLPVEITLGRPV